MMLENIEIYPLSESAATVRFGEEWSEDIRASIAKLHDALERRPFPGLIECVPALTALTVYYDPVAVIRPERKMMRQPSPFSIVKRQLLHYLEQNRAFNLPERPLVRIPVVYGGEFGPDLEDAARYCGLTPEQLIQRHARPEYVVHMIGFAPGFPYLQGMDESIAVPRKAVPRAKVPAGSVGIAGKQTGIYSLDSPGGWNIIGRTPLTLFHPFADPPTLLKAGMRIRFEPVGMNEWEELKRKHCGLKEGEAAG